jgi:starch synthase
MDKKRLLLVAQEMDPYLNETTIGEVVKRIAPYAYDNGMDVRILMPRFGLINERRNRLHEVVRLSGMNIIVDDDDFPLIIKVASLPNSRIQVYFMDNDDFFKRKFLYHDEEGNFYDDNHERMVFFCKSIFETVRKFGWAPDIIHCNGWMTSLIPLYAKTTYAKDPVFTNSKVVYSLYKDIISDKMPDSFIKKARLSTDISEEQISYYQTLETKGFNKGGAMHADALIIGDQDTEGLSDILESAGTKPTLEEVNIEEVSQKYFEFYKSILA